MSDKTGSGKSGSTRGSAKAGGLKVNDATVSDEKMVLTDKDLTTDGAIKLSLGKLRLQTDYDVIFPRRARCEWMPNAGRESRTLSCAHHSAAAPRRSI